MHTAKKEMENVSSGPLQEVKNSGKLLTVRPKKWSRSLTEGGCLPEGSNCKTSTGKIWVLWIGGRFWEVVAHGGSTVFKYKSQL